MASHFSPDQLLPTIIYADYIRLWSYRVTVRLLKQSFHSLLDDPSDELENIGLTMSLDKSRFIMFPGLQQRSNIMALTAAGKAIPRTRVVDTRDNGVSHVRSTSHTPYAIQCLATAARLLCGDAGAVLFQRCCTFTMLFAPVELHAVILIPPYPKHNVGFGSPPSS